MSEEYHYFASTARGKKRGYSSGATRAEALDKLLLNSWDWWQGDTGLHVWTTKVLIPEPEGDYGRLQWTAHGCFPLYVELAEPENYIVTDITRTGYTAQREED